MLRCSIILVASFGVLGSGSTWCSATLVPCSDEYPAWTEINKYLIVGFKKQSEGDAVNLQNGEFGADREVLSTGGTSPMGASFPTINSVFDQRWGPSGSEAYLLHPVFGTQIAPWEGIDYSGNIALTSSTGRISVSDTDIFADLGEYDFVDLDGNVLDLDDIGVVAATPNNPIQSISNADYFPQGAGENSPLGTLPEKDDWPSGVGIANNVDLSALTDELEEWKTFIEGADGEFTATQDSEGNDVDIPNTITKNIEDRNYKDGSGPYLIELLKVGETPDTANYDLSVTDTNGDGFVIIDVNRGSNDWEITNSDIIIDGPAELKAIFRINGESNMNMTNSSIQIGEGGIADDHFGAIFFKGDSEGSGSSDAVFSGNNVVLNGIALWELNEGTADTGKNEIDIQNGQGCAQFIASTVLHTSNSRFNKCWDADTCPRTSEIPEPSSLLLWLGLSAVGGFVLRRRRSAARAA